MDFFQEVFWHNDLLRFLARKLRLPLVFVLFGNHHHLTFQNFQYYNNSYLFGFLPRRLGLSPGKSL